MTDDKYKKLGLSILFDAIGMASFAIPFLGEISDLGWAPLSAFLMTKLFKGNAGKVGALVSLVEEALPGLDVIPTFTIMWVYTYVFKKESAENEAEIMDI